MKRRRSGPAAAKPGNFDPGLRQRATAFLALPVPRELQPDYVPDSLADRLIAACSKNEAIEPEALEIAELACAEYEESIAAARTEELRTYYATSRDLLGKIIETGRQ